MTASLYDQLMERPDAHELVNRAKAVLDQEAEARTAFREWLTPSIKAEFINGERILHSPVTKGHWVASKLIAKFLDTYAQEHNLGQVAVEKALIEIGRHDFEPDINFWRAEVAASWEDNKMVFPPPNLVIEILLKSTESRDRGIKFESYQAYGVEEYWLVDARTKTIEQYFQKNGDSESGKLVLHAKLAETDQISSAIVLGFEMPVEAAFDEQICHQELKKLMNK